MQEGLSPEEIVCELLAMSARQPATVSFSLDAFSRHGGLSGPHEDGWGVAYLEGRDARLIREPAPAASSACVRFIETYPIRSRLVLSHIRRATRGKVTLENTQPFARELGGRLHLFAHNGDLDASSPPALPLGRFRPLGETDSERAFCALLARLEPLWLRDADPPTLEERRQVVVGFASDLRGRGVANFLYTDGELLFAHGHERHQADGRIRPPGLHLLCRRCSREPSTEIAAEGFHLVAADGEQSVVLVASVPLTGEGWEPLGSGEVLVVADGEVVARSKPLASE